MVADPYPAEPAAPALRIQGLGKRYPRADGEALRGVDLDVGPHELVAVVGHSGCGKTTLLRLVAGLEVPDRGTISIEGETVAGNGVWLQPENRGVGMVFQNFALFPHLSVERNIAFGLKHLSRSESRARTERMLELVELRGLGDRYPHQLSGGQQQRVALARSLAPEPRVLLLDEPFSNLDAPLKAALRDGLVRVLRETGVPTLLVVHDVEDVVVLADRVAVMKAGHIVREGAPIGLCRDPGDPYVAGFFDRLRTPEANRFAIGSETSPPSPPSAGFASGSTGPERQ